MPRVRCPVCDGRGVVGAADKTCPECHGKGYIGESDFNPLGCLHITIIMVAGASLLGATITRVTVRTTVEAGIVLKWIIIVSAVVLLLALLPNIIRWARKRNLLQILKDLMK